jgi:biotin transport system substrate-specific component
LPVTAPFVTAPGNTLADALLPRRLPRLLTDALLVLTGTLLIAASARLSIRLPFTPVPITGQTFAILLTGMLLGARRGGLALLLYLAEGAFGLPVFAGGGAGVGVLFGKTGGYLWSYPVAAALVGWLAQRSWDRRPHGAALAMALGSLLILITGSLWLSFFVGGVANGFLLGMLPFLPGDAVKLALAAALLPGGWALVRRIDGTKVRPPKVI